MFYCNPCANDKNWPQSGFQSHGRCEACGAIGPCNDVPSSKLPSPFPQVGDRIHGFASGVFGRDSYVCRTIEEIGRDWLVTRNDQGVAEFATLNDIDLIQDPNDRDYCHEGCI